MLSAQPVSVLFSVSSGSGSSATRLCVCISKSNDGFEMWWVFSCVFPPQRLNSVWSRSAVKYVRAGVVQTGGISTEQISSSRQQAFCKTPCLWYVSDRAGISVPDNGSPGVLFPLRLAEKRVPRCLQTKRHIFCLSIYLLEIRHSTHLCGLSFLCKLWSYFTLWPDEQFCGL